LAQKIAYSVVLQGKTLRMLLIDHPVHVNILCKLGREKVKIQPPIFNVAMYLIFETIIQ